MTIQFGFECDEMEEYRSGSSNKRCAFPAFYVPRLPVFHTCLNWTPPPGSSFILFRALDTRTAVNPKNRDRKGAAIP